MAVSSPPVAAKRAGSAFGGTDLLMLLAVLFWGANITAVKLVFGVLTPLAFNALRFGLATALLVLLVLWREGSLAIDADLRWRAFWLGIVGNFAYQLAFLTGLSMTTAANTALLVATTPIWLAIYEAARGQQRPSARAWVGVSLSFLGALLVLASRGLHLSSDNLRGDLLVILGAICWSAYTVGAKPLLERHSPLRVTAATMMAGTPFLLLVGAPAALATDWGHLPPLGWGVILYSAVCSVVIAYWIWYSGVKQLGATRTGVYSNLVPVIGVAIAVGFGQEQLGALQVAGALAILAGLWLTRRVS